MDDIKALDEDFQLLVLYFRTYRTVDVAYTEALRKLSVTPETSAMLTTIFQLNNPTPMELARSFKRTPQAITAIVNNMKKKGLVEKHIHENRKNSFRITLTKKGLSLYHKIRKIVIFSKLIHSLPEKKRKQFKECLIELSGIAENTLGNKLAVDSELRHQSSLEVLRFAVPIPTELTDEQWQQIKPLIPPPSKTGRPRADDRKILNGTLWVLKTGARWGDVPSDYGAPSTCNDRFRTWQAMEIWEDIWEIASQSKEAKRQ